MGQQYKHVVRTCYLGSFVQAIVCNLAPILFIPLKDQFGLTYEQIGRLILVNFAVQLLSDLVFGACIQRVGVKRFAILANICACTGLWAFAILPFHLQNPYDGLIIGIVLSAVGSGILEILLSPIINAVPSDHKAQDMALAHSFYAWGQATVVLITTLAILILGRMNWPIIVLAWSVFAVIDGINFYRAELPPFVPEEKRQRTRTLLKQPIFLLSVMAMVFAGATEVTIGQWKSAFLERGMGFPKVVGDVAGLCLFAVALGIGRAWYGLKGQNINLHRVLIASAWFSICVYLVASLSPWPYVTLAACVLSGFAVSLLWPGMVALSAERFPLAGASMFALLAAGGDNGAAIAPWLVGVVADKAASLQIFIQRLYGGSLSLEQVSLRSGLLFASIYPVMMLVLLHWLAAEARKYKDQEEIEPTPTAMVE